MTGYLWLAHITFVLASFLVVPSFGHSRPLQALRLPVLLLISFVTVNGLSLAMYLRTVVHDLAITSVVALSALALSRLGLLRPWSRRQQIEIAAVFVALALVLYPASLGLSYIDPYRYGYSPRGMILAVAGLTAILVALRNWLGAVMLVLATLGFQFGIKPSPNYWDYLVDPFIALYCWWAATAVIGVALWSRRPRSAPQQSMPPPQQP